jgi:hypothetical protein
MVRENPETTNTTEVKENVTTEEKA